LDFLSFLGLIFSLVFHKFSTLFIKFKPRARILEIKTQNKHFFARVGLVVSNRLLKNRSKKPTLKTEKDRVA